MSTTGGAWQHTLLAMAQQGLENEAIPEPLDYDPEVLAEAYAACDGIANLHSHTFYMASRPLSTDKRKAVRSLYAFCRITDDLIDRSDGDLAEGLAAWRQCAMTWPPPCDDPVAVAWADTRARYQIPTRYAEQLVQGVASDLSKKRYANFDELAVYCYGVASTVGLMSMHIIGFAIGDAIPVRGQARRRDAGDKHSAGREARTGNAGRVYLPQDELKEFGLSDRTLTPGKESPGGGSRFMQFQVERNRRLYAEAMPGIALPGSRQDVLRSARPRSCIGPY